MMLDPNPPRSFEEAKERAEQYLRDMTCKELAWAVFSAFRKAKWSRIRPHFWLAEAIFSPFRAGRATVVTPRPVSQRLECPKCHLHMIVKHREPLEGSR